MNPCVAAGVLLACSVAGNALLWDALAEARDEAAKTEERRRNADALAKVCTKAVDDLRAAAEEQAMAARDAIAKAQAAARTAAQRADRERNRGQAVPGDACASAQVETAEWLQRRRGAQ